MSSLIDEIFNDKHFPKHPGTGIGDKRIFFLGKEQFYEENGKIYANFTSSEGKSMRYYMYYDKDFNSNQIWTKHLIIGTQFV